MTCLVQRDSNCGCSDTPQPAVQDPALPHGQAPGLAAPKDRWGSQAVHSTLPQRDPHHLSPWEPVSRRASCTPGKGLRVTAPSQSLPSPFWATRVIAGRLCAHIGLVCPGELGAGGFLEVYSPSSTPR